jgi:hypothetical protein
MRQGAAHGDTALLHRWQRQSGLRVVPYAQRLRLVPFVPLVPNSKRLPLLPRAFLPRAFLSAMQRQRIGRIRQR